MSEYGFDIKFYALLIPVFLLDLLALALSLPMLGLPWFYLLDNGSVPLVLKLYKEKKS